MRGTLKRLGRAQGGSVAPVVALSLVGLIAAGGLAVDFAQLANLDTELQNAADQSALAGATQLDKQPGAMERATAAAKWLVNNDTRFANDGGSDAAVITEVSFYATAADAESNINALDDPEEDYEVAKFVRVAVGARKARYAMTPIVGLVQSGNVAAAAVAGMGSAICKVPPVMMCNPAESNSNTDVDLDYNPPAGTGLRLITGNADVPGNFGWLEAGLGNGAPALGAALGYDSPPGECQPSDGVTTKTGMTTSVLDALNTRFDIYANGNSTCPSQYGGLCSPSVNTRKDLYCDIQNPDDTECKSGNSWIWNAENSYKLPVNTTTTQVPIYRTEQTCTGQGRDRVCTDVQVLVGYDTVTTKTPYEGALPVDAAGVGTQDPPFMGYPRDYCHAWPEGSHTCGTQGSGQWDRNAYFRVNYGWAAADWGSKSGLLTGTKTASQVTRWEVYQWEIANQSVSSTGAACTGTGCKGISVPQTIASKEKAFSIPATGTDGVGAGPSQADRRRLTIAVINCKASGVGGKTTDIRVPRWLDVFLVEPSWRRSEKGKGGEETKLITDKKDVYVEVIGPNDNADNGASGQVVRRDKPYLLK